MFMRMLCTPRHALDITLIYPIHYNFRQPFRPGGARYQLFLYLCLPFFYNSSLFGVPKSTKLPQAGIVQQRRKIRRCRLPQRRWAMCNCIFGRATSWVRKAKSIRACSSRNVSCFFFLLLRFLIGLVNLTCCPVCIVCSLGAPSASVDDE